MGAVELRNTILDKLNAIEDSSTLQSVLRYIEKHSSKNEVIAYTVQGKPLTKKEYIKKVKDADASIDAGRYTTLEDLEKEIRNW